MVDAIDDPLRFPVPEILETPRLVLRTMRRSDAPQLHEALAQSIVELRQYLWFLPWVREEPTLQSAERRCIRAHAAFLLRTDLAYLAVARSSGHLIGSAGLHRTDWSLPRTEVGYWIRSSETGRGYASEAVRALTQWALTGLGARRVELITDELNAGSCRVAIRCGFELEGVQRNALCTPAGELRNTCMYARTR